jgi:hypothetical protein
VRTTERAGAHSLQFGTYALRAAGLLAALAVRPVPSCMISIARRVNSQALNDVCQGQAACRCLRPKTAPMPDHVLRESDPAPGARPARPRL